MLELKKGENILAAISGIESIDEAWEVLRASADAENLGKLEKIKSEGALLEIARAIAVGRPRDVFVHTGSEEDLDAIRRLSIEKGEETPLAMAGHTIHYDLAREQARIADRTFYIVNEGEDVSVLANAIPRAEATQYVRDRFAGIMEGKTCLVGFFSRGPVGAEAAVPAIEITSSAYVMHGACLLYRSAYDTFDAAIERVGQFLTNVHGEGANRDEDLPFARVFMDRSWLTTFAMYCTYAGNTLLLKKGNHRFCVDRATYFRTGEELSEHMFLTGMKGPGGRTTYFAGAAPSGCGKTTTAMAGTDFVGDDLAQLWIAEDGTVRGINPEVGVFSIVADVNREGDPYLMKCLREPGTEVIWSNVLVDDQGVPHWTGNGEPRPARGRNHQGEWYEGKTDENGVEIPISHPNARCILRCAAIENYNAEVGESRAGARIEVITYSGRDADTMPPVWVAPNPDHGVVIGASIVSRATATEVGATGIKRSPWANAPFIPGPLADYMRAQFAFFNNPRLTEAGRPVMAGLNYFLTHEARGGQGKKLLGEKRDVKAWLSWLERFAHGDVEGIPTPIGLLPRYEDLRTVFGEVIDKEYPRALYDRQFSLYIANILARIELQREAYSREENLPRTLFEVYDEQEAGLLGLEEKYGLVVTPDQLAIAAV